MHSPHGHRRTALWWSTVRPRQVASNFFDPTRIHARPSRSLSGVSPFGGARGPRHALHQGSSETCTPAKCLSPDVRARHCRPGGASDAQSMCENDSSSAAFCSSRRHLILCFPCHLSSLYSLSLFFFRELCF